TGRRLSAHHDIRGPRLQVGLAPILVSLETERDVDFGSRLKLRGARGQSPPDRIQRAGSGIEHELEAVLSNRPRRTSDGDVSRQQHRGRIANSEWLEMAEERFDAPVQSIDAHFQIDTNFRDQVGRSENRPRNFVKSHSEIGHLVARDGDAGGSAVSAVAQQMLARLPERAVQVELGNGAARSLALLSRHGDQYRRSAEL